MKIYQVETSNFCNLSCSYCPHPNQRRAKGNMSCETFDMVIELALRLSQKTIYLHNFGEPLLNPNIYNFISKARSNNLECSFYTNGELLTEESLIKLVDAGLNKLSISNHIEGMSEHIKRILLEKRIPIEIEEVFTPTHNLHSWAGQVDVCNITDQSKKQGNPCIFERENAFVILWNGDIANCCLDCEGISVINSISEILKSGKYKFRKSVLCANCSLMRGEEYL